MQIFIARDGQQTGPFSLEQVQQMLTAGGASGEDLAWYEGAPEWMPLSQVPGVTGNAPPPTPKLQPIQGTPRPTETRTSGAAVASMILGILGFIILPIVGAIAAIITGHIGLGTIKKGAGTVKGRGMAIAGLIMGYLQIVLVALAIVAAVALPTFGKVQEKAEQMKSMNNARQILMACRMYAADNDGAFPASLQDLITEGVVDDTAVFQTVPPSEDGSEIGFEYTAGLTDSDHPRKVLIQSKTTYSGGDKIFGFVDGLVHAMKPDELPPQ